MGSYNLSCALSGLSISYGDRAVVVLMESNQRDNNGLLCFRPDQHIYSENMLSLAVPPIKGTYIDYGMLEYSIANNKHLEYINNEHNIDSLINYGPNENRTESDRMHFPDGLFAVWIHGDVWDSMIKWYRSNPFETNTIWPSDTLLIELGFSETGIIPGETRYKRLFEHPNWGDWVIGCDSSEFAKIFKRNGCEFNEGPYSCTFKDILAFARTENLNLDFDSVKERLSEIALIHAIKTAKVEIGYQIEMIKYCNDAINADDFPHRSEESKAFIMKGAKKELNYNSYEWRMIAGSQNTAKTFCRIWAPLLAESSPNITDRLSEYFDMMNIFFCCGKIMMPTVCGTQYGEHEFSKQLGNVTSRVAKKIIKSREY